MDIQTGEILLMENPHLAAESVFPAGSTAKPLSALSMMKHSEDLDINPEKEIICSGKFFGSFTQQDMNNFNLPADETGRHYFKCSLQSGHGNVNMKQALIHSCSCWFLTMAAEKPEKLFHFMEKDFALTSGTGAALLKATEHPAETGTGSLFAYTAASIGEGGLVRISPLKAAQIYAGIFSGGKIPVPFQPPYKPDSSASCLPFSKADIKKIYKSLEECVRYGTLKGLKMPGMPEIAAGKTGTATVYCGRYRTHGWNAVHIRHKNRDYVLVTFVLRGSGSKEALHYSQEIINTCFK